MKLFLFFILEISCTLVFSQDDIYFIPPLDSATKLTQMLSPESKIVKKDSLQKNSYGSSCSLRFGAGTMYNYAGYVMGLDYTWFDNKYFGLGGKYTFFQHRALPITQNILTIHYYAPMVTFRIGNKSYLYMNVSYGLVILDDFGGYVSQDGYAKGVSVDLGIDWNVFKNRYFGFKISGLRAILPSYNINTPAGTTQYEKPTDISRIDLTLGYKFY